MAVMLWRTTLYPGAWTYVWSRQGDTQPLDPGAWVLARQQVPPPIPTYSLPAISLGLRSLQPWDQNFHHALRVPNNVPPGSYLLGNPGVFPPLDVTMQGLPDTTTASPPAKTIEPTESDPTTAIENALNFPEPGYNGNVLVKPGHYRITRRIRCPARRTISGDGAVLVRDWEVGPDAWVSPFFHFTGDGYILLDGLTFVADRRPAGTPQDEGKVALANSNNPLEPSITPTQTNVTLRRCVFRNVQLGDWPKPGLLAEDCTWEEGGGCLGVTGPALFLRCTIRGLTDGGDAWLTKRGSGMALLDCDFINTLRGPFLQAREGNIENNLLSGVVCENIAHLFNGCEGIGMEPHSSEEPPLYAITDNLFLHFRYQGEGPGFHMFFVPGQGNLLRDFVIDGGTGIRLDADPSTSQQTLNKFIDGEVRGGECVFLAGATGNDMQNVAFVGPRPTRGALFNHVADPAPRAVITNFASNSVDYDPVTHQGTVRFARLLDGWTATDVP
jgi:hypothetical protein